MLASLVKREDLSSSLYGLRPVPSNNINNVTTSHPQCRKAQQLVKSVSVYGSMLQISTWRRCKTKAMHSIKPWGWEEWAPCNAVCTLVAARTASPGPLITETAVLHKG